MRILHIIHRYPPAQGGSEKYFEEISKRFAQRGDSVEVWTTDADQLERFWIRDRKRLPAGVSMDEGVTVRRFRTVVVPQHARVQRLLCLIPSQNLRRLFHFPSPLVPGMIRRAAMEPLQFDVVHATALPYTSILYAAWIAARRSAARLCYTPFMHIGEKHSDEVRKWYARRDQIQLLQKADAIFVQTPTERDFLISCGLDGSKCLITGVGVNPEEIVPPKPIENLMCERYGLRPPYVFTLGAKSLDKGTLSVIEAMARVWQQHPEVTLVLAGDEMSDFQEYWGTVPSESKKSILNLGRISDAEKVDLIRQGLIYLNPSRTDSFGITFLEAWLWEKPVIGARAGGVVDVISHGEDGFLVEFGCASEIASKILELIRNPSMQASMGAKGKTKTLSKYTWESIFESIAKRYQSVVKSLRHA